MMIVVLLELICYITSLSLGIEDFNPKDGEFKVLEGESNMQYKIQINTGLLSNAITVDPTKIILGAVALLYAVISLVLTIVATVIFCQNKQNATKGMTYPCLHQCCIFIYIVFIVLLFLCGVSWLAFPTAAIVVTMVFLVIFYCLSNCGLCCAWETDNIDDPYSVNRIVERASIYRQAAPSLKYHLWSYEKNIEHYKLTTTYTDGSREVTPYSVTTRNTVFEKDGYIAIPYWLDYSPPLFLPEGTQRVVRIMWTIHLEFTNTSIALIESIQHALEAQLKAQSPNGLNCSCGVYEEVYQNTHYEPTRATQFAEWCYDNEIVFLDARTDSNPNPRPRPFYANRVLRDFLLVCGFGFPLSLYINATMPEIHLHLMKKASLSEPPVSAGWCQQHGIDPRAIVAAPGTLPVHVVTDSTDVSMFLTDRATHPSSEMLANTTPIASTVYTNEPISFALPDRSRGPGPATASPSSRAAPSSSSSSSSSPLLAPARASPSPSPQFPTQPSPYPQFPAQPYPSPQFPTQPSPYPQRPAPDAAAASRPHTYSDPTAAGAPDAAAAVRPHTYSDPTAAGAPDAAAAVRPHIYINPSPSPGSQ